MASAAGFQKQMTPSASATITAWSVFATISASRLRSPRRSSAVIAFPSLERQRRAVLGLGPGPVDAPRALVDRHVVDAGLAAAHVALVVELPLLVAVAAPPLAGGVAALILEAHRDPVAAER